MNTRKVEMLSFITKFPNASTTQVVDHMMEKFENTERHQHRAALQRMKKSLKAQEGQMRLPVLAISGRTQVQTPNVANTPKFEKQAKVASADPLPPQQRRKGIEHVVVSLADTRRRQARVLSAYHELSSPTPKGTAFVRRVRSHNGILRIIKAEFPATAEPPTLAMIHQVFKAEGDSELYPTKMRMLFGERTCPTCGCTAKLVDNVYRLFGFREQNARAQSYCRACRTKKGGAK